MFEIGEKVVRTTNDWNGYEVGKVYTVRAYQDDRHILTEEMAGTSGSTADKFVRLSEYKFQPGDLVVRNGYNVAHHGTQPGQEFIIVKWGKNGATVGVVPKDEAHRYNQVPVSHYRWEKFDLVRGSYVKECIVPVFTYGQLVVALPSCPIVDIPPGRVFRVKMHPFEKGNFSIHFNGHNHRVQWNDGACGFLPIRVKKEGRPDQMAKYEYVDRSALPSNEESILDEESVELESPVEGYRAEGIITDSAASIEPIRFQNVDVGAVPSFATTYAAPIRSNTSDDIWNELFAPQEVNDEDL